ncbi:MAG: hypothetical protein IKL52_01490 [Candidatus Gastranaerophilales bacterium]|nr:hypothetical protein [Candidatus Gastranaerophilales bacterium]
MIRNTNINFKGYNMSSKEIKPINQKIDIEKLRDFNSRALDKIAEDCEYQISENGKCAPYIFHLNDSYAQNRIRYAIEYDPNNPKDQRVFSIGVSKLYNDKMAQEFVFKGTKREILDYLKSQDSKDEIYETILRLSNKIEEIN